MLRADVRYRLLECVRRTDEQVVRILARFREPLPHPRRVTRFRIVFAPFADRPATLDVAIRALEPGEQRGGILTDVGGDDNRITGQPIDTGRIPELRQPDPLCSGIHPERDELRDLLRGLDALEPFVPHALRGQLREALNVRLSRFERPRVDAKFETRAEAQRAQNPQIVFLKPPVGIADRTDELLVEILLALEGIAPLV